MLTTTTLPTLASLTARCGAMARGGAAAHRWVTPMTSTKRRARSGVVRADGKPAELAPLEQRVDLRVGKVLSAKKHEEADKLYIEEIDLGEPEGPRTILSGLVPYMSAEDLTGKNVIVFANLKARKLAGIPSHGMILAASDDSHERVELLVAPEGAVIGERVRFGESDEPQAEPQTPNQLQKKKTWEELQPLLVTDDACVATYNGAPMMTSAGAVKCATLAKAHIG